MILDKQFEQWSVNADLPAPLTFESTFLPDSADGLCVLQMEMFTETGTLWNAGIHPRKKYHLIKKAYQILLKCSI